MKKPHLMIGGIIASILLLAGAAYVLVYTSPSFIMK
jgi:hypothetical protein